MLGVVIGACEATNVCTFSYIPAYLYGRKHLGAISGLVVTAAALGSGTGPIVMAVSKDYLGSFAALLFPLGLVQAAFGVACLFITKPAKASGA